MLRMRRNRPPAPGREESPPRTGAVDIDELVASPWTGLHHRHEFLLHHMHEFLEPDRPGGQDIPQRHPWRMPRPRSRL
jgi:hypothetical protein